jgi:acetoin:2,6-dichlorophenolindophenol oxidoreductase subunit alpha
MSSTTYPSATSGGADQQTDTAQLLTLLSSMHEIRFFEQRVQEWFSSGAVRGSTHLYQGQEAVAVGVTATLAPGDTSTCTYRGHGTVLAMGAPLDESFGEILGRHAGLCAGKGGSMHLTDLRVGALGSFAIVGGHIPISAGAAWAAQLLGTGAVSACFFGDGAANIGTFHETLNLAGVWKLPVVFVIENNLYGEYSPIASTTANTNLAERAAVYGMPGLRIDGNDVLAVKAAAENAVARARSGEGPTLLEAMTYRHSGHSRSDPAKYRPAGELERWLERDPIRLAETRLQQRGIDSTGLEDLRASAKTRVDDAAARALSWPEASAESRFEHVWITA